MVVMEHGDIVYIMKDFNLNKKDVLIVILIMALGGIIEWLKLEGVLPTGLPSSVVPVLILAWYVSARVKNTKKPKLNNVKNDENI